uniref:Uncharacterized protein n=1 Tax=Arundo donax TaxID=35708 RepID=A0A0A9A9X7_ARUDO
MLTSPKLTRKSESKQNTTSITTPNK